MPRETVLGLGRRIRERRLGMGIKLSALARRAGIATSYLSEVVATAASSPSADVIYSIADNLETTIPYLLNLPDRQRVTAVANGLPASLARAKQRHLLAEDEVALLADIEYRGKRPRTEEDWFFLLCAIRRSVA